MTETNNGSNTSNLVYLNDSVQTFDNGSGEVRLRKGVWSYEEAVLDLSEVSPVQRDAMSTIMSRLAEGGAVTRDQLAEFGDLTANEIEEIDDALADLLENEYLSTEDHRPGTKLIYDLLGGSVRARIYDDIEPNEKPILFVSDSQPVIDYACMLAEAIGLPMEVMSHDDVEGVASEDFTTRYVAYPVRSAQAALTEQLDRHAAVVVCLERPRVKFLRNLNRALIEAETPVVVSAVDGPFTLIMTLNPPETGCIECYEGRQQARLQDRPAYHEFVQHTRAVPRLANFHSHLPIVHGLASQAILEGFMLHRIGRSRSAGRLIATYVPVQEIQIQDVLRVPYCPACGFVSKAQVEEMYASTSAMVDTLVERVEIERDDGNGGRPVAAPGVQAE